MGTTCASFHALWHGSVDDAAKAISRAYSKLGYERLRKPPAKGGKQVILLARASVMSRCSTAPMPISTAAS
jgi:hypothetical protein